MIEEEIKPDEKFNVAQRFANGSWEYVRREVTLDEAKDAIIHYINSVGAQLGMTIKVVMTDRMDRTLLQWEYGKGIVFPTIHKGNDTVQ